MIERTRVLLVEEAGVWVAQCLEHDLAVQGRDRREVEQRLRSVALACGWLQRRLGDDPLKRIGPALDPCDARYESAIELAPWECRLPDGTFARTFLPAVWKPDGPPSCAEQSWAARVTAAEFRERLNAKAEVEAITYPSIGTVLERLAAGDIIRLPFAYPDDEVMAASVERSVCNALWVPPTAVGLDSVRGTACER